MASIWVKEFTGGLDTRRLAETVSGAALIRAIDGHINRGGEFEKRAAFVSTYTLPAGTIGLANDAGGLIVFGSAAEPTGMPAGVTYQRLQHPDGASPALARVPSFDLYAGKVYAVGEFADGSLHHFYDGVRVVDFGDGRARASFRVTDGFTIPAASAVGSFEITGGSSGVGNQVTNITIDGVAIISGPVAFGSSNADTASDVAAAINSHTSTPNYTAVAAGQTVTVTAVSTGTAVNGKEIIVTPGGTVTVGNSVLMAGGAAVSASSLASLTVDGVSAISSGVSWATSNSATASAIASAINGHTSSPNYIATAVGDQVNIIADDAGTASNGLVVAYTTANGLVVTPASGFTLSGGGNPITAVAATTTFTVTGGTAGGGNQVTDITVNGVSIIGAPVSWVTSNDATASAIASAITGHVSSPNYTASATGSVVTITASIAGTAANGRAVVVTVGGTVTTSTPAALAGGVDAEAAFIPGSFVKTIGSRVHCVSGPNAHFSGINQPTKWTTDATGAGFIDMSTQASGAEELTALANYQRFVAVFSERVVQIWTFDSDPANNAQVQVLKNTGTGSPLSVTEFGDEDLFYLDESGLRSLRARDSSNAAATTDIGVPVDTAIVAKLNSLTDEERANVVGLIEPRDGRFWLIMKDVIYVFSFFAGSKISAWTTYAPGFNVSAATVFNRRAYLRSGDTIYCFGGTGASLTYDATSAVAWLPFLDGNAPSRLKMYEGVDVAATGQWQMQAAFIPTETGTSDSGPIVFETTFGKERISLEGESTHISLRFASQGTGPAVLSSVVIHFNGTDVED